VSQPVAEPPHLPPATEQQVRSHASVLVGLAAEHGITGLAFASPGRLIGHVAEDRDLFDMFEFQRAAADLLGAEVTVYSDGALRNDHVSADLVRHRFPLPGGSCTVCRSLPGTRRWPIPRPPANPSGLTEPGPISTTCAITSPTLACPTSMKASSAASRVAARRTASATTAVP
jgi:hypothetical protein